MNFLNKLLDANDNKSAKRFVTLIVTFIYIVTNIVTLVIAIYAVLHPAKGRVEPVLFDVLKQLIEWDAWIILGGLCFVTLTSMGNAFVEKAKVAATSILTGNTIDTVNVDNTTKPEEGLEPLKE
jgi:hypothetical protein